MKRHRVMVMVQIVAFTAWARASGIPFLWANNLPEKLTGSRFILARLFQNDRPEGTGLYTFIIRDCDYELVKLYVGRFVNMADYR